MSAKESAQCGYVVYSVTLHFSDAELLLCRSAAESNQNQLQIAEVRKLTPVELLKGIHCFRVHDATEQLATVRSLMNFVAERPAIRSFPHLAKIT